jgi:hypothetical protein
MVRIEVRILTLWRGLVINGRTQFSVIVYEAIVVVFLLFFVGLNEVNFLLRFRLRF